MTGKILFEANGLMKSFGGPEPVLRDVSLALAPGELVALMGPSGSGKSTFLALAAGLLCPDAGVVRVEGTDLWAGDEAARESIRKRYFGFVFQGFNLFPALTALEQLEIVLSWCGSTAGRIGRDESKKMLERLGLGAKLHLRPAQLSGGEKQRVAIARALVKAPLLCFADEPTSALDGSSGAEVVKLLREMAGEIGTAVLMVTHDDRVLPFVDRLVRLRDGRLVHQEKEG